MTAKIRLLVTESVIWVILLRRWVWACWSNNLERTADNYVYPSIIDIWVRLNIDNSWKLFIILIKKEFIIALYSCCIFDLTLPRYRLVLYAYFQHNLSLQIEVHMNFNSINYLNFNSSLTYLRSFYALSHTIFLFTTPF